MHIASLAWIGAAALSASARLEAENTLLETEQRLRRELAETQRQRIALLQAELGVEVRGAADDRGPDAQETEVQPVGVGGEGVEPSKSVASGSGSSVPSAEAAEVARTRRMLAKDAEDADKLARLVAEARELAGKGVSSWGHGRGKAELLSVLEQLADMQRFCLGAFDGSRLCRRTTTPAETREADAAYNGAVARELLPEAKAGGALWKWLVKKAFRVFSPLQADYHTKALDVANAVCTLPELVSWRRSAPYPVMARLTHQCADVTRKFEAVKAERRSGGLALLEGAKPIDDADGTPVADGLDGGDPPGAPPTEWLEEEFGSGEAAEQDGILKEVPASLVEAGDPILQANLAVLMESGAKLAAAATKMAEQAEPEKERAKATTEKAAKCDEKARRAVGSADRARVKIEAINGAVKHMESEAKSEFEKWEKKCEAAKKSWWGSSDDECSKKNELQAAYEIEKKRHDVSEKALRAAKWSATWTKRAKQAAAEVRAEARGSEEQVREQDDRTLKDLASELRALSRSAGAILEALRGTTSPSRGSNSGFIPPVASGLGAHTVLPGPHPMYPGAERIIIDH